MSSVVKSMSQLGFPFKTPDPFLFAVYHNDAYPVGNALNMYSPRRGDGADFDWSAPYRMYHGDRIPGFPQHPHRGFETMTLVREGTCDHTGVPLCSLWLNRDDRTCDVIRPHR